MGEFWVLGLNDEVVEERADWADLSPEPLDLAPAALPAEAFGSILRFDQNLGRCRSLDELLRMTVGTGLRSFGARGAVIALLDYRVRLLGQTRPIEDLKFVPFCDNQNGLSAARCFVRVSAT